VLGAHPANADGSDGVSFRVWAPRARSVRVVGAFSARRGDERPLARLGDSGVWAGFVPGIGPGERYRFEVHGRDRRTRFKADPYGFAMERPPETASRVVTPSAHRWRDAAWMQSRAGGDSQRLPMHIYEVHLGSWRRHPDGSWLTYAEIGPLLAEHCQRFGFTHVELLPIAEHPFDGSWGYQVTGYYAPTARFGTPDQLRAMIDELHLAGIGVILDWVPGHFPRDEHALARFDGTPLYEHADPMRGEHPDWGTLIFDFGSPPVRNFLIGNARYWLEEFHVDGLRVDAVASMLYLDYSRKKGEWKPNVEGDNRNLEAIAFLRDLNLEVHAAAPGITTAAEESTAFPGVTASLADGGLGFDFKWDLGWMHDTLDYYASPPRRRTKRRRRLTFRGMYLASERWVLPLSHDEVVHLKRSLLGRMPGRIGQRFAGLRSLLANQVGQPGKKLLFMGTELAPAGEWNHDLELPWATATDPLREGLAHLLADLGALYHASPALWSGDPDPGGFEWIDPGDRPDDRTVVAWVRRTAGRVGRRGPPEDELVVVQNLGAVARAGFRLGLPRAGRWDEVLNTDSQHYGGSDVGNQGHVDAAPQPAGGQPASALVTLPPIGTIFLRRRQPRTAARS
jgi:1,4-alpha-glucan branching enzyme